MWSHSVIVILDKTFRTLMGMKVEDVKAGKVALRARNIELVWINPADDPEQVSLDDFKEKEVEYYGKEKESETDN